MKSTRILITGCSGFIGSRLAIRMAQAGYEVLATSRLPSLQLQNELGLPLAVMDVLKPIRLEGGRSVDAVIHCATANDIVSRNFEDGFNLTVLGTKNVLDFALHNGISRVMYFSTLQVYGTELCGEIAESTQTFCQNAYALNHWFGEELCRMYSRVHGLKVLLLRPANVYGVPDVSTVKRETLVPTCFVKQALQEGQIVIRSSGRQKRNFVSTDEVAATCIELLRDESLATQVVNIGSELYSSIRGIAEITGSVYFELYRKQLPIRFESDEPFSGNDFRIDQGKCFRSSLEESRASIRSVIRRLFELLKEGNFYVDP